MVSHFPHASRSSHLPSIHPSIAAACFWLDVAFQMSIGGRIRPRHIFVFMYVRRSVHHPKRWYGITPTCQISPHYDRRLSVGCCIVCSNGSHLRPRPCPSLCFSRGCILAPQTKEPTVVRAQPMPRALYGSMGAAAPRFGSMADVAMEREGKSR